MKIISADERLQVACGEFVHQELMARNKRTIYATVRLDDDDALAPRFINDLEAYCTKRFVGFCVSFAKGYVGFFNGTKYESFLLRVRPKTSMGLSYIRKFDPSNKKDRQPKKYESLTVYSLGNHENVDTVVPTIIDPRREMVLRTVHAYNDFIFTEKHLAKFREAPDVDPGVIAEKFPGIRLDGTTLDEDQHMGDCEP